VISCIHDAASIGGGGPVLLLSCNGESAMIRADQTCVLRWAATAFAAAALSGYAQSPAWTPSSGTLTPAERAAGWKLLFDGRSSGLWRAFRGPAFPEKGWRIAEGCLENFKDEGAVDLVTTETFGDFELELEWRAGPKANSGIMYRVTEEHDATWKSGPEFQILDDGGHNLPASHVHSAGAMYDLYGPAADKKLRPAGEFNHTRIRLRHGIVQHWLNGLKLLEADLNSEEFVRKVAASKFKPFAGFGSAARGHIALQHHGGDVAFRNIRVRDLSAPMPGEVMLFNGRDLTGWTACLPEGTNMSDVWSVQDGVLICKGQPNGYIRTEADYESYVLKLEWRFNPVTRQAGNSGVLLRIVGPDKVWPRCVEAQLQSGNAGDFWQIDEFPMKADPQRTQGRNVRKTHAAERPVGEWNEYEIIVAGDRVTLKVNGETLNEAWEVLRTPGKIGLQSEGAEIHFRNIRLAPIAD